jgi:dolichol-phosphate mannosyltransferase
VLYATWVLHATIPGWSSLVCIQIIFNGTILTAVGLVGDYVARIYEESKGRPLYVVAGKLNSFSSPQELSRVVQLDVDSRCDKSSAGVTVPQRGPLNVA